MNYRPRNRGIGVPHPAAFWCQLWFYKWKLLEESEKKNLFFFSPTVELESHIWGDLQTPGKPAQELFVDSLIRHHGEVGVKYGDPFSSEGFESPHRSVQWDGFCMTFQRLISSKNWTKAVKGFLSDGFCLQLGFWQFHVESNTFSMKIWISLPPPRKEWKQIASRDL